MGSFAHARAGLAAYPQHDLRNPATQHCVQRLLAPCSACRSLAHCWRPPQELCRAPRDGDVQRMSLRAAGGPQALGFASLAPAWAVSWPLEWVGPFCSPQALRKSLVDAIVEFQQLLRA